MIGEVVAVLSALKALNDGIATVKESGANLESICGKWADASEQYNDVEKAKAGKLSYKDAIALEGAKRQLKNFDRQLQDKQWGWSGRLFLLGLSSWLSCSRLSGRIVRVNNNDIF